MTRLEALADAIKKQEGWYPFSRSWRNNNPGNLRYSHFQKGTRNGYAYFSSFTAGWLGLYWDLWLKCSGNSKTYLSPQYTLLDLINVWAPTSDGNKPREYANAIAKRLKIPTNTKLYWFLKEFRNGP